MHAWYVEVETAVTENRYNVRSILRQSGATLYHKFEHFIVEAIVPAARRRGVAIFWFSKQPVGFGLLENGVDLKEIAKSERP